MEDKKSKFIRIFANIPEKIRKDEDNMTEKLDKEIKELVLWRLETSVPKHLKLSIGGKGTFSKEELKKHIEQEDEIGLTFVNMQLDFIKDITSGKFSKVLAEE